jgi:alanine racemase
MRATRAIIHLENLKSNLQMMRDRIGGERMMCLAVKADAYGHGAIEIAKAACGQSVGYLAVATVDEGSELIGAGIRATVILLSVPLEEEIPLVVRDGIVPIVTDVRFLEVLEAEAARLGKKAFVHLKIDTGMGRLGIRPEDAISVATKIRDSKHLSLQGVCTHLSASDMKDSDECAENTGNVPVNWRASGDYKGKGETFTRGQLGLFCDVLAAMRKAGIDPGVVHAANSGAIVAWPELFFDMVRPGILAYGYYPSGDQERILSAKPVMELATKVVFMKRVEKGTPVSYGMTYVAPRDTVIATLPVGYGDGYSRLLSNRASVGIGNKKYPVAGRVCMDHTMVDLGPNPDVKLFSDVTLFGPGRGNPDAEEIASLMGTIPYEVTCLITKRVPRVYTG